MGWTDWIAPILQGVGAVGGAISQYQQGQAYQQVGEAQAGLYRQNADWARYEADQLRKIGWQNWQYSNTEASRIEYIAESNARMIERLALAQARAVTMVGDFNADSAVLDAEFDALASLRAAHRQGLNLARESNRVQGAQVAGFAKAGVEMSGTPMTVLNESIRLAEEDIAHVIEGGRLEADTLRLRGETTAAITRGSAAMQAGILSMQGQHEASMAREQGMLEASRLRWSADIAYQQAELSAKRSEAQAGIFDTQAQGANYAGQLAGQNATVGSITSLVTGAASLLGNKSIAGALSGLFGGGGTAAAGAGVMGGGMGGAMAQGLADLGIGAGTQSAGITAAATTAAETAPTMFGMSAIPGIGLTMAGMGAAAYFLSGITDSSHTPESARDYIEKDLFNVRRIMSLGWSDKGSWSDWGNNTTASMYRSLWSIRQLASRAGYTSDQVAEMVRAAGYQMPTWTPEMIRIASTPRALDYGEGTYG